MADDSLEHDSGQGSLKSLVEKNNLQVNFVNIAWLKICSKIPDIPENGPDLGCVVFLWPRQSRQVLSYVLRGVRGWLWIHLDLALTTHGLCINFKF